MGNGTTGYPDISAVIRGGALPAEATPGLYSHEVMLGRHILIEVYQGGTWALLRKPGGRSVVSTSGTGQDWFYGFSKVLPAALDLATSLTLSPDLGLSPAEEFTQRIKAVAELVRHWGTPERAGMSGDMRSGLTGEQILILGALPAISGFTAEQELERCEAYSRTMRDEFIPYEPLRKLFLVGLPNLVTYGIPAQYSGLAEEFSIAIVNRNLPRLDFLLNLTTFIRYGEDHTTLDEFVRSTPLITRTHMASRAYPVARLRDPLPYYYWQDKEWWAKLPDELMAAIGQFSPWQIVTLFAYAHACPSPGASALLVREIAAGRCRAGYQIPGSDPCHPGTRNSQHPLSWCADAGLTGWVHDNLVRMAGYERAHELFDAAAQEGGGVPATTWAHFLEHYDELKDTPVSWWVALGG